VGSELNCTPGRRGKTRRENGERARERLQTFLTKDLSGILDSGTTSYWAIMRPVNTRTLVTLMRNAIWRGRRGPFIFNGGEGAGGIRQVAPVGYHDPPLHKKSFWTPPLCVPNYYFDWNDLPVGREFDCKFFKKSNPHPMPCLPRSSAGITLIGALFFFPLEPKKQRSNKKIIIITPDLRLP